MSEGFHVLSCESTDTVITVPIPDDCKPLSASVQTSGGGTGLLASFYNPEDHTWVIRHAPADLGHVTLTVRVLTLRDPEQLYELHVAMTTAEDGATNEERYELKRRSHAFKSACEAAGIRVEGGCSPASGGRGLGPVDAAAWPPQGMERPKYPRDLISLACPLPILSGFVLCGGGFVSDYPVFGSEPSLPISTDLFYDRMITDEAPLAAAAVAEAEDPFGAYKLLTPKSPQDASLPFEYAAWSVTAAPNAGLACFSIGLRRRDPNETSAPAGSGEAAWRGGNHPSDVTSLLLTAPVGGTPNVSAVSDTSAVSVHADKRHAAASSRGNKTGLVSPTRVPPPAGPHRRRLMSPSRFSTLSSKDDSSPDSTLNSPDQHLRHGSGGHREPSGGAQRRDGRTAADAAVRQGKQQHSSLLSQDDTSAGAETEAVSTVKPQSRQLFLSGSSLQRVRRDLLRVMALRKRVSIRYRPSTHVMDLQLPPPHGFVRARYGMCKETRGAAKLFYR